MRINRFEGEYAFLSNFFYSPLVYEDIIYPTAEHAFQAAKTLSVAKRFLISQAQTPNLAKSMGRQVELREDWDVKWRYDAMLKIVNVKFSRSDLDLQLRQTGNAILIEGNTWHDNTWGDCSCSKCIDTPGHNVLGWMLMQLRTRKLQQTIPF